jgi:AraC-like DNA-binding protein
MKYRKVYPSERLRNYVHCYYIWEDTRTRMQPLIIESPPSGYCALVINYGEPYYILNDPNTVCLPRVFITGQATELYVLKFTGWIGILGVVLRPSALYRLLQIPAFHFTDKRVDLQDFIGTWAWEILEQVGEALTPEKKIEFIENFLCRQLLKQPFSFVDRAANMIEEKNGLIRINELSELFDIGRRHIEKKFREHVGLTPKKYVQIRRMSHICFLLSKEKEIDWQDIIYYGGFYDQSHFIKEFKTFMKRNPGLYVKDNRELVKML